MYVTVEAINFMFWWMIYGDIDMNDAKMDIGVLSFHNFGEIWSQIVDLDRP